MPSLAEQLVLFPLAQVVASRQDPDELAWWDGLAQGITTHLTQMPQLRLGKPLPHGVESVVFEATWHEQPAVVKFARAGEKFSMMCQALAMCAPSTVPIYHHDEHAGVLVMKRLGRDVGKVLDNVTDQQRVLLQSLRKLWQNPPKNHGLEPVQLWLDNSVKNREQLWLRAQRPCSRKHLDLALQIPEIYRSISANYPLEIINGDAHAGNLLQDQSPESDAEPDVESTWCWIDIRGQVGQRIYDVADLSLRWLEQFSQPQLGTSDPVELFGQRCQDFAALAQVRAQDVWQLAVPLLISKALWSLVNTNYVEESYRRLQLAALLSETFE